MKVILEAKQIEAALDDLTDRISSDIPPEVEIAVIGIRSRGEIIAQRLSKRLSQQLGKAVSNGTLDITLYRDDLNDPQGEGQPAWQNGEDFSRDNCCL